MASQPGSSDDLIAELARMMASDANDGKATRSEPQVPPTNNDAPSLGSRLAPQPQVRIPGVTPPAQPIAAQGPEKFAFDFGKAPTTAPIITPEPLANWQDRVANRSAQPVTQAAPRREPSFQQNSPAAPQQPQPSVRVPGGRTDSASPAPQQARPQPQPQPQAAQPQPRPSEPSVVVPAATSSVPGQGFNFDFGFNKERPQSAPEPARQEARPAPARQEPPAEQQDDRREPDVDHDAIADLIAAELDVAQNAPAVGPQPAPVAAKPTPAPVSSFRPNPAPMTPAPSPRANPMPVTPMPVTPRSAQQQPAPAARPAPAPDADKFVTAPVFGLSSKAASQPAPRPNADPMDEIESLIGDAVRVELANSAKPAPTPSLSQVSSPRPAAASPVVPPLTTQFAPRRTSLREMESKASSADDTILAAASATGAEVGRFQMPVGEAPTVRRGQERVKDRGKERGREKPVQPQRAQRVGEAPRRSLVRSFVVPAVAAVLLLAAGGGVYWFLGTGHVSGPAPVLTADTTPAKQAPAPVANAAADAPRSPVFDQIDGVKPADGTEQLVSRDQAASTDATRPAPTDSSTEAGLANRKVRTVTVRPDGSIVSGDDSVAGGAVLPVDRPNVPAVPGQPTADASDLLSGQAAAPQAAPAAATDTQAIAELNANAAGNQAPAPAPIAPAAPATAATQFATAPETVAPVPMAPLDRSTLPDRTNVASSQPTSSVNAVDSSQNVLRLPGTAPAARPSKPVDLIGNLVAGRPAAAAPPVAQATTANSSEAAAINSPAFVQLSSQRSEAEARTALSGVQKRYGTLFGASQPQIVRVDLGAKGIYYRVLLPASSLSDASQICTSIKSAGGDCFPQKG